MIWKKIPDFKNYSINELGQVRNDKTGNIKKPYKNKKNGYFIIDLWENNKSHKITLHRLLAKTFIPNPENKPTVDHADGDRENNNLSNLRWATYSEQNSRFETSGVRSEKIIVTQYEEYRKKRGGGHIKWGNVINRLFFNSISDCARYFGCSVSNISLRLEDGQIGRRGITRGFLIEYFNGNRSTINKM